jgi:putative zinc finger protein
VRRACDQPLEFRDLVDYWFEELSTPDAERVEQHLFECDDCGGRLRALAALRDGVRRLAHAGTVQMTVTRSFLETAAREGLRSREYVVRPGERVACTVTAQDDLLISRMRADFTGVSRLDVLLRVEGEPEVRIPDVPIGRDAEELIMAQAMPAIRALGRAVLHYRLVAREGPSERVLGDYTFDHTPTLAAT